MNLVELSFDIRREEIESPETPRTEYEGNTELYPSTNPLWYGVITL